MCVCVCVEGTLGEVSVEGAVVEGEFEGYV